MRVQKINDYILKNGYQVNDGISDDKGRLEIDHVKFIVNSNGLLVSIPINKSNFSRGFYKWFSLIDEVDTILDWLRDHDWDGVRFCSECGKPMNSGYTTDEGDIYICDDCFGGYLKRGELVKIDVDDGVGGYYLDANGNGTGIYYTEWE